MWYITVAFFLGLFSIIEFSRRKIGRSYLFNIAWIVLTFMLVFRFGQGTDYYAYYLMYQNVDGTGSFLVNTLAHGEIGWYMLNLAANKLGMSFFVFIGIVSFVEMVLIRRFIMHYSPYKAFSLLLFYPTFYLTACYSTIRQGLVFCIFMGICVNLIIKRKYVKYYLIILCLVFIHTSAIALFLIPLCVNFKLNRFYIIGCFVLGFCIFFFANRYSVMESYSDYLSGSTRVAGILVRVILLYFIWRLHRLFRETGYDDKMEPVLYRIYITGFILFILLIQSATLSQRLTMPFKAMEVALLPILIHANRNIISCVGKRVRSTFAPIAFYIAVMIVNVEFVKNIYSYIDQGNYHSWVTPMSYPYSSVFDQNEIRKYITNFDEED